MYNGQSAPDQTCVNPFSVSVAVEVFPHGLIFEGGEDFAKGSDARGRLCRSDTGVESYCSIVELAYACIRAVAGRTVSGFFPHVPLAVPGSVRGEAACIDVIFIRIGLTESVVDRQIVLRKTPATIFVAGGEVLSKRVGKA